jgi:hypothetical protein
MVFLSLFRYVARYDAAIAFLIVAFIIATALINVIAFPVAIYAGQEHGPIPDARMLSGYTAESLRAFYTKIGDKGCEAYVQVEDFDCYAYMPLYMVLLGSLLVRAARVWSTDDSSIIPLLPVLAVTLDLVENYVQRQGCLRALEDYEIRGASMAMQSKWALIALSLLYIIVAFVAWSYKKLFRRKTSGKTVKQS